MCIQSEGFNKFFAVLCDRTTSDSCYTSKFLGDDDKRYVVPFGANKECQSDEDLPFGRVFPVVGSSAKILTF